MQAASLAGVDVAETQFFQAGERELLLVKRFDREARSPDEITRRLYVSAHTVLGLQGAELREDPARSYVALSYELRRWCATRNVDSAQQRELFRRMVFNSVCGNGDDHPRNHGLVRRDDGWQLSPAFDIAPFAHFGGTLAMAVNRDSTVSASATAILSDCESFGYERAEAIEYIERTAATLQAAWDKAVERAGFTEEVMPAPVPVWLDLDAAKVPPGKRSRRGRTSR
jgi:serine/threonine-protein kinase HipA